MKDESGPCKAIKERYFFNVNSGSCERFEYGGCSGNSNNFETMEECEEACVVSGGTKLQKLLRFKRRLFVLSPAPFLSCIHSPVISSFPFLLLLSFVHLFSPSTTNLLRFGPVIRNVMFL